MHELSIAAALAESLINYSREHHVRIKVAHIKVGPLSGIDPEALKFAWAPALENACSNVLTDCVLQITLAPISHQCRECGKIFEFDKWTLKCPACGNEITIDEDVPELGGIECPNCGESLEFDLDSIEDIEEEDED